MVRAVRGAAGIERNGEREIREAAVRLVQEIMSRNRIAEPQIISILFSLTRDLNAGNPATGLRSAGFADTPLFCVQEAEFPGTEPQILRVLVTYNLDSAQAPSQAPVPVYLGRAVKLRPDLAAGAGGAGERDS